MIGLFLPSDPAYTDSNYLPLQMWHDQYGNMIVPDGVKYETQELNRRLIIHKINEADEGNYTCSGVNSFGVVKAKVTLDIYCK